MAQVAVTYRVIIAHRWCGGVGEDEVQDRMQQWCTRMRIKFSNEEIAEAINQAERRKHLAPAERLAEILGLEYCERQALAINTIGAIDMTKRQRTIERKKRKRERDRIRAAIKRRKRNTPSRSEWLADHHHARTKPWALAGISRRTWYRRRAKMTASNGTGGSGTGWSHPHRSLPSDTPVPKGNLKPLAPSIGEAVLALAGEIGAIEQAVSVGGRFSTRRKNSRAA